MSYDLQLIKLLDLAWRCNENIHCQSVSGPIYLTIYCNIFSSGCQCSAGPHLPLHHLCSSPVPGGPGRSQHPQLQLWDFSRVLALNTQTSPALHQHTSVPHTSHLTHNNLTPHLHRQPGSGGEQVIFVTNKYY